MCSFCTIWNENTYVNIQNLFRKYRKTFFFLLWFVFSVTHRHLLIGSRTINLRMRHRTVNNHARSGVKSFQQRLTWELQSATSQLCTRKMFSSLGINDINHRSPKLIHRHACGPGTIIGLPNMASESESESESMRRSWRRWSNHHSSLVATLSRGDEAPGGRIDQMIPQMMDF